MTLEEQNIMASETGGRTYRGIPALSPSERRHREQEADELRLAARLRRADQQLFGSGHPVVGPEIECTHVRCSVCKAKNVRLPNTRCLRCRTPNSL